MGVRKKGSKGEKRERERETRREGSEEVAGGSDRSEVFLATESSMGYFLQDEGLQQADTGQADPDQQVA